MWSGWKHSLSITRVSEENHDNKSEQSENRLRLKPNFAMHSLELRRPFWRPRKCVKWIDEIKEYAVSMAATNGFKKTQFL
jgi:hypothetical protein